MPTTTLEAARAILASLAKGPGKPMSKKFHEAEPDDADDVGGKDPPGDAEEDHRGWMRLSALTLAEWDESKHPRDERGRFGAGSGAPTKGETGKTSGGPGGDVKSEARSIIAAMEGHRERLTDAYRDFAPKGWSTAYPNGMTHNTWRATWDTKTNQPLGERVAEVKKIEDHFFQGKSATPEGERKLAVLMMGGPGAGKTTAVGGGKEFGSFVTVNPDDVKELLPEYGQAKEAKSMRAAEMVHEESSIIGDRVLDRAIAGGYPVLVDKVGREPAKMAALIERLHAAGYDVDLRYVHAKLETALARGMIRAERTGRKPPVERVVDSYDAVPGSFEAISRLADTATAYDSDAKAPMWTRARGEKSGHVTDKALADAYVSYVGGKGFEK